MFYFSKNPGITNTGSADHSTVQSVFISHLNSFFRRIYITVSKNRNMHAWIVFHISYQTPVSFSFIHLFSGSPMNVYVSNAYLLMTFSYYDNPNGILIPVQSCFYGNGNVGFFDHSFSKLDRFVNIF